MEKKKIIPAFGFTKKCVTDNCITGFMSWQRLVELLQEKETKKSEILVGIEINEQGITMKFMNRI